VYIQAVWYSRGVVHFYTPYKKLKFSGLTVKMGALLSEIKFTAIRQFLAVEEVQLCRVVSRECAQNIEFEHVNMLRFAVTSGNPEALIHAIARGEKPNPRLYSEAARTGNIKCIEWMAKCGCHPGVSVIHELSLAGDLDALKSIIELCRMRLLYMITPALIRKYPQHIQEYYALTR
jgi:hypothetical protein